MNRREFLRLSALGMADSLNPRLNIGDIVVAFYLKFWSEISINSCWSIGRILPSSVDTEGSHSGIGHRELLRVWAERDGNYLPVDPYEAYAKGAAKDLDFLQGCTKDEMGYFVVGFGLEGYNAFAADEKRTCDRAFDGIQSSGGYPRHGETI